jgi:hypothetical protein
MPKKKLDPLERSIERAMLPDQYINYQYGSEFVSGLERVKSQIDALVASGEPERAANLYESMIAGCYEKAEEIDDSDGYLGDFAESVFCAWIKARQTAKAKPEETAQRIWEWMKKDDYGFCYKLEVAASQVFDRKGMKAFERVVRAEHDIEIAARMGKADPDRTPYYPPYTSAILKTIYQAQRNLKAYMELCSDANLNPADCLSIAEIHKKGRRLTEALEWVERGIDLESREPWSRMPSFGFAILRRRLLQKLGRENEALESAWADFAAAPSIFAYDELFKYVRKSERKKWREKALDAAIKARPSDFMAICTKTKEWDRLASFTLISSDIELENISHYVSGPAANSLAKSHPAAAAKLFRALGMRTLKAGKSKYYTEAIESLRKAKASYQETGLTAQWDALVAEIRRDHRRKHGFLSGFERLASKEAKTPPPSFLEKARRSAADRIRE